LHSQGFSFVALFYSRLFWPEFVEINVMIFLKEAIEDDEARSLLDKYLEQNHGDKAKAEQSFNLTGISYLFGKKTGETTDEEDLVLAKRLAEMWRCKLLMIYPVPCSQICGAGIVKR
jgi:hypothetical protein